MATGKFVCHHPGIYLFTTTVQREPGPQEVSCYFSVNGSQKFRVVANNYSTSGYPSSSGTLIIHLSKGDVAYLSSCSGRYIHSESVFSGVLIQPDVY